MNRTACYYLSRKVPMLRRSIDMSQLLQSDKLLQLAPA